MRSYFTFLPFKIQKEMHFPKKKDSLFLRILSFVGNIYRDINGHIQLYKADVILFSSNPLMTMSYIINHPEYKNICVVSSPDVSETIAFPYNLIELADFRAVIEKLLFKESVYSQKQGYNTWIDLIVNTFYMKIQSNGQNVFTFNNDYFLGGNREYFSQDKKYLFTYLAKPDALEVSRSVKCEDIRKKIWFYFKSKCKNYSFYIREEDKYSYSIIHSSNVVNLDIENSYENFEKWLIESFSLLNDPNYNFDGEKIYVRN